MLIKRNKNKDTNSRPWMKKGLGKLFTDMDTRSFIPNQIVDFPELFFPFDQSFLSEDLLLQYSSNYSTLLNLKNILFLRLFMLVSDSVIPLKPSPYYRALVKNFPSCLITVSYNVI